MAKRIIESDIWKDSKFKRLNPRQKLLWLYLLTNENSTSVGVYHISFDEMSFELKLDEDEIKQNLMKLTDNDMLTYDTDNEEIVIYKAPIYNICSWGKPMIDKVNSELSKVKNINNIELVLNHLKTYQIDHPNDRKSGMLENIIPLYENALKPIKEKGKENIKKNKGNNNNTNNYIYNNNESCHESYNDTEMSKEEWNDLIDQIEKGE